MMTTFPVELPPTARLSSSPLLKLRQFIHPFSVQAGNLRPDRNRAGGDHELIETFQALCPVFRSPPYSSFLNVYFAHAMKMRASIPCFRKASGERTISGLASSTILPT